MISGAADKLSTGGLRSEYKTYGRQKCFVGHSQQAQWSDDILSACAEVLPKFDLEPWYAADHFEPTKPFRDKVMELIANARYGIYDLSNWIDDGASWHLPRNVLIELGMAIVLNRPTLLLRHTSNNALSLPACLQGLQLLDFAGDTTLRDALEERLPQWINAPPERDWLNRFCIFGTRVCRFREAHPRARQWGQETLRCHIADGLDEGSPDFLLMERDEIRRAFESILCRYSDLDFGYLAQLSPADGYDFTLCRYCHSIRSTPFGIYRILPDTPARVFITVGMSIAMEAVFGYDIPKVLLVRQEQDLPWLLHGYDVVEAGGSSEVKRRLKACVPSVIQRIRETTWEPRPLPFRQVPIEVTSLSEVKDITEAAEGTVSRWKVYALGEARVIHDGRSVSSSEWRGAMPKEVFFYILLHGPVERDAVGLVFWPDLPAEKVSNNFHNTLYRIRQAVGADAVVVERGKYALGGEYWFDVQEFEALIEQASLLPPHDWQAQELWQRAVELYQGDFLPEVDRAWCIPRREQLRDKHIGALIESARCHETRGAFSEAVAWYRRALEEDELREDVHRRIMRAYFEMGRRSDALAQYRDCRKILEQELGIEPSRETKRLRERIAGRGRNDLRLLVSPPSYERLVSHLEFPIPRHDPNRRLAHEVEFLLHLENQAQSVAREVVIEMSMSSDTDFFLAYDYPKEPLVIEESPHPWRIALSDTRGRCFFEGGADFVCHSEARRLLGLVRVLVPYGQPETTLTFSYRMQAEGYDCEGSFTITFVAEDSPNLESSA